MKVFEKKDNDEEVNVMSENYDQNRLITPWGYIGYSILFSIPIIGLICAIVFAFSSSYPCRKNYARSFLILIIIAVVLAIILVLAGFTYTQFLQNYVNRYSYY